MRVRTEDRGVKGDDAVPPTGVRRKPCKTNVNGECNRKKAKHKLNRLYREQRNLIRTKTG